MTCRLTGALAALLVAAPLLCPAQPVDVTVRKQGDQVVIDVDAKVAAPSETVWAVLTDYEHMARFVSALTSSQVLSRHGNELEVAQTGEARLGFLHFSFATVRAVELTDGHQIRSHLIRGDFKSYEFTTHIDSRPDGTVRIVHHGEYVPNAWVPPGVGPAMIETETRRQYADLIAEIVRRGPPATLK